MKGGLLTATGLVLAAVLLVAVNVLAGASLTRARLDLTENSLYTLSSGTRTILASLEEPVTLRLYLSERLARELPSVSAYATRVRELLEEYERAAAGNIRLVAIDPEPFSEEEDRALGYGLRGIPLEGGEETFYFGLVGSGPTGEEEVIPFFARDREPFLEYDLTRLVHSLAKADDKVVGLLSTLPLGGGPGPGARPWMIAERLRQLFELRSLEPELEAIPEDVDVLMVAHPKDLPRKTLYAIDQFVLGGGHALVFVDAHAEADRPAGHMGMASPGGASRLGPLLEAWGLELVPDRVVADLAFAMRVQTERGGRLMVLDYPVWMNVPARGLDGEDPVTADLSNLTFGSPGHLRLLEERSTSVHPLARSSEQAMLIDTEKINFLADPQELLREFEATGERYLLAARVTGRARSAFPDGPPAAAAAGQGSQDGESDGRADAPGAPGEGGGSERKPPHLAEAAQPINVLVVADTDLLQDRFWVRVQELLGTRVAVPTAANGAFVGNALEHLTGSDALISVRSRGSFERPFARVEALRRQAELRFREKERELLEQLERTEQALRELERRKGEDEALILSDRQQAELVRFRQERVRIRGELREVRRELRRSIETLEARLKFLNIGLVPIFVGVTGVAVGAWRARRRGRDSRAGEWVRGERPPEE